jgi:hypothetical protein
MSLVVGTVLVLPGGALEMGTPATPVTGAVTLTIADVTVPSVDDPEQWQVGLLGFGRVTIHGSPKTPFVRLAAEPLAGSTQLTAAVAPLGWRRNDRLVVPDTRHLIANTHDRETFEGWWETPRLQVVGGTQIGLRTPLAYPHRGARNADGAVEYLPHVGNLSRTVTIRSEGARRGHVLFGHGAEIDVQYAAFVGLGRTREAPIGIDNLAARYAVHLHHLGDGPAVAGDRRFRLVGNAVDGGNAASDLKWGLVVHNSHHGLVADNVLYNSAAGAGLVTEDGHEQGTIFERNLTVRHMTSLLNQRQAFNAQLREGLGGHGYWFAGPRNTIRENVAANATHDGFAVYGADPALRHLGLTAFAGNEVYGATERGIEIWDIGDRYSVYGSPDADEVIVRDSVVWHVHSVGIAPYYVSQITIDGWIQRGDPEALGSAMDGQHLQTAIQCAGAANVMTTVRRADIQNMAFGIRQRGRGRFSALLVEDTVLTNDQNVTSLPFASRPVTGRVEVTLRRLRASPLSGRPPRHVVMQWAPAVDENVLPLQTLHLEDVNGITGQVFWQAQAPERPLGFRDPSRVSATLHPEPTLTNGESWARYGLATAGALATCATTVPGIEGYVCP